MALPIKSNTIEVVSGGAANPKLTAGTDNPTLGLAGTEGSIYLRYGVGAGQVYVKTGAGNLEWGLIPIGGTGSLDQSYDFGGAGGGRTITADAGAIQINALTGDAQAALYVDRSPVSAAAAIGIDLIVGASSNASAAGLRVQDAGLGSSVRVTKSNTGSALFVDLTSASAKALEITVTSALTGGSPVSIVANTTGTTSDLLSISKVPGGATAGNAISVSMGANATGSAIYVSAMGSGPALEVAAGAIQVANSAAAVSASNTGRIRYNSSSQRFQASLNGAAYTDLATGGSPRVVTYVATGSENGDFFVTIGATLAADTYNVGLLGTAGAANFPVLDFPNALGTDRTTTQFRVLAAAQMTVGDIIKFLLLE